VKGLEACARGIVEELGERIAVFKPQSAFFEAFGSRGVAVLERVLADIREAGAVPGAVRCSWLMGSVAERVC